MKKIISSLIIILVLLPQAFSQSPSTSPIEIFTEIRHTRIDWQSILESQTCIWADVADENFIKNLTKSIKIEEANYGGLMGSVQMPISKKAQNILLLCTILYEAGGEEYTVGMLFAQSIYQPKTNSIRFVSMLRTKEGEIPSNIRVVTCEIRGFVE